jgi:hypothetical protein
MAVLDVYGPTAADGWAIGYTGYGTWGPTKTLTIPGGKRYLFGANVTLYPPDYLAVTRTSEDIINTTKAHIYTRMYYENPLTVRLADCRTS